MMNLRMSMMKNPPALDDGNHDNEYEEDGEECEAGCGEGW